MRSTVSCQPIETDSDGTLSYGRLWDIFAQVGGDNAKTKRS
jgi:hypothetical protein